MSEGNPVLDGWNDIKNLVTDLELDAVKNSRGTAAAGVRLRKGLRVLKAKATELTKLTIELDKTKKSEKTS